MNISGGSKFVAGPLPKHSLAPANASYSGLLECPLTDRIQKILPGGNAGFNSSFPPTLFQCTSSNATVGPCEVMRVWCMVCMVCMVCGGWCVWCVVDGVYGVWWMVCMVCMVCMVQGVYGTRCMVQGVWYKVYGTRCMVQGVWYKVYGTRCVWYKV
jgi:hypothetical protein